MAYQQVVIVSSMIGGGVQVFDKVSTVSREEMGLPSPTKPIEAPQDAKLQSSRHRSGGYSYTMLIQTRQ